MLSMFCFTRNWNFSLEELMTKIVLQEVSACQINRGADILAQRKRSVS